MTAENHPRRRVLRSIDALDAPPSWAEIPPEEYGDDTWPQDVAAQLCPDERGRETLARSLPRLRDDLFEPGHQSVAVWVPDPATAEVAGYLTVDWLVPDEGEIATREYYRGLLEPDRRGTKVLDRMVDDVDVPAGPALRVRESLALRDPWLPWRRRAQLLVVYTVFPDGCDDAVQLTFVTGAPALADALAVDAASIADSLRVS